MGAKAGLRIKFSQRARGQFLHQLIKADLALLCQLAQPGVLVIRQGAFPVL
jgi:hypothetical protein